MGSVGPTPIVSWFFSQRFAQPHYYTQSVWLELKQDIQVEQLEDMLNALIHHHDLLRSDYNAQAEELFYNEKHLDARITI